MELDDEKFTSTGIPRDRFGRPMIVPPGGGKPTAYTRCTTYVGVLEDTYNLSRWQQRMVATGMAQRPDLVLAAHAHRDDKDELNKVCQSAMDAAAAGAAAGVGTALHKLTERLDRGEPLDVGMVPNGYAADIKAYERAMTEFEPVAVEQFTVLDELKIGGTPDLVVRYRGELYIADKKTGSIEWGAGKMAMQLAVYAHSQSYQLVNGDPVRMRLGATDAALDEQVSHDRGIIIHLPAGSGTCELHWIDIAAGWHAVQLAGFVREHRARRHWLAPLNVEAARANLEAAGFETAPIGLLDLIVDASTVEQLNDLYRSNREMWTEHHTQAAAARKVAINGGRAIRATEAKPRRHQALRDVAAVAATD